MASIRARQRPPAGSAIPAVPASHPIPWLSYEDEANAQLLWSHVKSWSDDASGDLSDPTQSNHGEDRGVEHQAVSDKVAGFFLMCLPFDPLPFPDPVEELLFQPYMHLPEFFIRYLIDHLPDPRVVVVDLPVGIGGIKIF